MSGDGRAGSGSARAHTPSPAVRRLGRRLLQREREQGTDGADGRRGVTSAAAAAERAARTLGQPLSRLVGVAGCQALLTRALHLAGREWPVLAGVRATPTPAGGLEGLGEALEGTAPAQAHNALAAVLAHLVWLLATFLGDDLALRTVREAWPDVHLGEDGRPDADGSDTGRRCKVQAGGEVGRTGEKETT